MRLIDADALKESFVHDNTVRLISDVIDEAPTIDAIEVVRCKDCKWWGHESNTCEMTKPLAPMCELDFCSYGERKDNEID